MNTSVSFCIFSYNQEKYIEEAIESAVLQTYKGLEIIISDDCSTDNTWQIISKKIDQYKGQYNITINRTKQNMGIGKHISYVLCNIAHGKYIILAGGDDISLPNRVEISVDAMAKYHVSSFSFNQIYIDSHSKSLNKNMFNQINGVKIYNIKDYLSDKIKGIPGASRIIDRKLIDTFGKLNDNCPTEDTTFCLRALLLDGQGVSYTPVIKYRLHDNNASRPENLYKKFNPHSIYQQYFNDIEMASKKKLITPNIYIFAIKKINNYLERESYIRLFYEEKNKRKILSNIIKLIIKKYPYKFKFNMIKFKIKLIIWP